MSLRSQRMERLSLRRDFLTRQMAKTNSDTYEYFTMIEIDRIDSIINKYKEFPKCHKCKQLFTKDDVQLIKYDVPFHEGCFNRYEHYYGLDKWID